jgi:tetratricopeptide (TPR) repeat protein
MENALRLAGAAFLTMALLPAGPAASQSVLKLLPGFGGRRVAGGVEGLRGPGRRAARQADRGLHAVIDIGCETDIVIAGAYTNRGNARRDSGDMDQAIQDFNKAIGLNSKLADAFGGRGAVFVLKGQFDFAILDYRRSSSIPRTWTPTISIVEPPIRWRASTTRRSRTLTR